MPRATHVVAGGVTLRGELDRSTEGGTMANKKALVTGASRGIGKAISLALADAGFDVAIAARTVQKGEGPRDHSVSVHREDARPLPGSLEETGEEIRNRGRETHLVAMDLTDLASVERAIGEVLDAWGNLDVVVNNGRHIGPGLMDTILDTPIDAYPKFLEAHGVAPIRIVQLTLPKMLEAGGGTFVTISSGAGTDFYPTNPPGQGGSGLGYRIGKAAGHTLVGSILAEYAKDGVRAFNVEPGFVRTERNSLDAEELGFDTSLAAPPEAIGAVVVWLATNPDADELMRSDIDAQSLAVERGIYPDWRKQPVS
jgi:NAD(P)-dependent dehydrogenase (short-subunit alcohol dehydrogenase family)